MISRLGVIGAAMLFIVVGILILSPLPSGYEISVYRALSIFPWVLLVAIMVIGIVMVCYGNYWRWNKNGFILIALANVILFGLPVFRYYFFGRDDAVTHLGYVSHIVTKGYTVNTDFYPLSHILASIVSVILRIDPRISVMLMPSVFYTMYLLAILLISKVVADDLCHSLFIATFAILIPIGIYSGEFYPIGLSIFFIPFLLYIVLRKNKNGQPVQNSVILILLTFTLVYLHPLAAVYFIIILLLFDLSGFIAGAFSPSREKSRKQTIIAVSVCVALFAWISNFSLLGQRIASLFQWFKGEVQASYVAGYQNAVAKSGFALRQVLEMILKVYGPYLIYLLFFIMAILVIFKRRHLITHSSIFFAGFGVVFAGLSIASFLGGFDVLASFTRVFAVSYIGFAILSGLVLYGFVMRRKVLIALTAFLLTVSSVLGVYDFYASPHTAHLSADVSKMEYDGGRWLVIDGERKADIIPIADQFAWRMRVAFLGSGPFVYLPPHFGIGPGMSLADMLKPFKSGAYIVVSSFDRSYYGYLWPTQGSFNVGDFQTLEENSGVNHIYVDGGFDVYARRLE